MRLKPLTIVAVAALVAFGPAHRTAPTKWALVVGISDYINFGDEIGGDLPGAANDARAMADVLIHRYGFQPDHVKLILDREATRDRFRTEFTQWLPSVVKPGDEVVFFYAGHGSQAWDLDGDEPDGLDETICPTDVLRGSTKNDILDDEMGRWLRGISTDNIVVIWDKCHAESSTRSATPFAHPRALARDVETDVPRPTEAAKGAAVAEEKASGETVSDAPPATVLEIAAAQANQVAMGAAFPTEHGPKYGGAFTTNFVQNLWNAPEGATYAEVFKKTRQDLRREHFTQVPTIDSIPQMNRPLFAFAGASAPVAPAAATAAAGTAAGAGTSADAGAGPEPGTAAAPGTGVPQTGFVPVLDMPAPDTAVLGGGSMADMTDRSLYMAGTALLRVDDVAAERARASVVSRDTRGLTVVTGDSLAVGSRARLVAYRYPDRILRVSIADLPTTARDTLRQALMANPGLALLSGGDAVSEYIVRPRGDSYVVLNLDGFPRDSVPAPDAVAGARNLVPLLRREFEAYQLARLENPASPFAVQFEFANGRNDFRLGEAVKFRIRSERAGYLTLVDVEPDGKVVVLYPNQLDQDNRIQAGQEVVWPTPAMRAVVQTEPPTGRGIVRAFVTERPMFVPLSVGKAVDGRDIWQALRGAAGRPPFDGSDALPVRSWATRAIPYEVKP